MQHTRKGFTLIELLIFITILSLFFVAAVSVSVASLRNLKINEHRILATRYAEELGEWLRAQKEIDFEAFHNYTGSSIIFPCSPIVDWDDSAQPCSSRSTYDMTPPIFNRSVNLSDPSTDGNQVHAIINVSWNEVGRSFAVPLQLDFAIWEQ